MQIIEDEKFNILRADESKQLTYNEEQEEPYYFKEAYIPKKITLEECKEKFIEIDKE